MNNPTLSRHSSRTRALVPACLIVSAIIVAFLAVSCSPSAPSASAGPLYACPMHPAVHSHDPNARCNLCGMPLEPVDYYTCTMHPSVKSQDPDGKCPICSMNLVPVFKKPAPTNSPPAGADTNHVAPAPPAGQAAPGMSANDGMTNIPEEFSVPVNRQQQIGVASAPATRGPLRRTLRAAGIVAPDKQRQWDFVAHVEGYVQKLLVSSPGDHVEQGQPLLTIYSPDLLTSQRELLALLRARDQARASGPLNARTNAEELVASAERRLLFWEVTSNQIAELEKSRVAQDTLTLASPFAGVVQDLPVDQGHHVVAGDHLLTVADLSTVWVWAEFYQEELPLLKPGLAATLTSSALPGRKFSGKISVVDPFLNDATRTGRVRFEVANPGLELCPAMYVDVDLEIDAGEGLIVPVSAVMPTGRRNVVFVDKGGGRLEPRFIETGVKYGTNYAVNAGLAEGERVVISGNFLIDAEAKVQGALKTWENK